MKGVIEGRNVHYVTGTGKHLMAVIVKVWSVSEDETTDYACVNLAVFNPVDGEHGDELPVWNKTSVLYDAAMSDNTWHWIEQA